MAVLTCRAMAEAIVVLGRGRERSLRLRHPWVFSGAVERILGEPADGDPVLVRSADGADLGRGVLNRQSQIMVRMLTFDPGEPLDNELWRRRVAASIERRRELPELAATDAMRLVHGEADGLPGLVVDRYGDWLALQALSLAAERALPAVLDALEAELVPSGIVNRSDDPVRAKEGLEPATGLLRGTAPDGPVTIVEDGLRFEVDLAGGQKTGCYLDQRANRALVTDIARGRAVLDAFCYTGGFSVAAAAGGAASLVQLDSSAEALAQAQRHLSLNGLDAVACEQRHGDAFVELRRLRDAARSFDLVVLDPPKFAPVRSRLAAALRGYKDINLLALKLLRPGGLLATFSCSGAVDRETFQTVVFQAAADAGREVRVIADLGQPGDHPVLLSFPESRYLKGLLCHVA